jgi:hypothetical protein
MHKVRGNYSSVHVGKFKIYVAAVEAFQKNRKDGVKTGWNSVWKKKWCISEFDPRSKANVLFCRFFLNLTRFWTKLRVLVPYFPDFTENSNIFNFFLLCGPRGRDFCKSVLRILGVKFWLELETHVWDLVVFDRLLFLWIKFMMEWNYLTIVRSLFMILLELAIKKELNI